MFQVKKMCCVKMCRVRMLHGRSFWMREEAGGINRGILTGVWDLTSSPFPNFEVVVYDITNQRLRVSFFPYEKHAGCLDFPGRYLLQKKRYPRRDDGCTLRAAEIWY